MDFFVVIMTFCNDNTHSHTRYKFCTKFYHIELVNIIVIRLIYLGFLAQVVQLEIMKSLRAEHLVLLSEPIFFKGFLFFNLCWIYRLFTLWLLVGGICFSIVRDFIVFLKLINRMSFATVWSYHTLDERERQHQCCRFVWTRFFMRKMIIF